METGNHSFEEFYKYYLSVHNDVICLRLHFLGTSLFVWVAVFANILIFEYAWFFMLPAAAIGYGLAWYGHFQFENNKPATFSNPVWSARAGLRMYLEMLTGKIQIFRRL